MNIRTFKSFVLALLIALALPLSVFAQSSGSALSGRVVDDQGAAIPGVTVTAANTETGLRRVAISETDGSYRFPSIPVGTYTVTADLSGFATVTTTNVKLNVATERDLDITLRQASVSESITVTAEAPLVQTTPAIGTVVSRQELEGLPLNGRQFANLAQLAPGTTLSVNSDPTKPGQLTIALNGGSGRNVNFVIDGGDNTDDTIGGALQNFNLEAVEEFKIQTMQYKAEYGRSTGGVLSVVTKTGTNTFGGSAYGFFRSEDFNEETESEQRAGIDAQPYDRKQYGLSFGGPIIRDKAHFFATYEKTDRETAYTLGPDALEIFPEFAGQSFALPFEDELGTAKATANLSPKQLLQVRYGYQKNSDKYGAGTIYTPSFLGTVNNDYESILAGHTGQLSSSKLNEFVFQWTRFDNSITPDSSDPLLYFPSGVYSGQNINTPQTTHQEKSQFKDDFSWSPNLFGGRHDFKTGFNYIHEPILGGDFTTGTSGQYNLLTNDRNSPVTSITIFGGFFGDETPVDQYSAYIQDDWAVTPRLTLNLGIRYDYWEGFDLDQRSNPIWQALSQSNLPFYWLDGFRGGKGGVLENDDDNLGPRLGFTYDLAGDSRKLLRGGVGRYYDFPYTNATILFPASSVQSNYGVVYFFEDAAGIRNADGSFFRPGQPGFPPNQLPPSGSRIPPNNVASPTQATPYSDQLSLGYSWEVNPSLGLNIEAVSIRYKDIPYRFRANPRIDTDGNGTPDRRAFPQFSARFRVWMGDGEADYDGVNLGFRSRIGQTLEMQGFYTYSKAEGNVLAGADEFRIWNVDQNPGLTRDASVDATNPRCSECFGPLFTDAPHRVTLSALYHAPFGINVSGIARYRSGHPFTLIAGRDVDGDGYGNDLAAGQDHVNSERGDSFSQIDVRLSKEFKFGGNFGLELIAELFNLLDSDNPTGYGAISGEPTKFAGDPGQGEQRLAQLGFRVRY